MITRTVAITVDVIVVKTAVEKGIRPLRHSAPIVVSLIKQIVCDSISFLITLIERTPQPSADWQGPTWI
jgi:hypothetical protein